MSCKSCTDWYIFRKTGSFPRWAFLILMSLIIVLLWLSQICDTHFPGKGNGTWDTWVRIEGNVADGTTGDIACLSYYKYVEDVQLLKDMGVSDDTCGFNEVYTFLILSFSNFVWSSYHWRLRVVVHSKYTILLFGMRNFSNLKKENQRIMWSSAKSIFFITPKTV